LMGDKGYQLTFRVIPGCYPEFWNGTW